MKKISACLLFLFLLIRFSFAQSAPLAYNIAPWTDNKKAAVSLTFDDGISGQFMIALPLLNEHHFKATFFVTTKILTGQLGDWHLVKEAARAGHEIANHALTHPHFDSIAPEAIAAELVQSNAIIENSIQPKKSLTHAFPFGEGGQETKSQIAARAVVKKYFIGARATRNRDITFNNYDFAATDDDYFKINSDMIADSASIAGFETQLDACIAAGGWFVPTYHGIVNGWIIVPKNIFERQLNELDKRKENIWIAPFADVLKYHKERNSATLAVVSESKNSWILQLSDSLHNDKIWNQPLTINLKSGERKIKTITQSGINIPFTVSRDELVFNAVPGKDNIIITKE